MEQNDTLISEISLCNNYKFYKNAQVVDGISQKLVKYQVESKINTFEDWYIKVFMGFSHKILGDLLWKI